MDIRTFLEKLRDDNRVTINLLITTKCNFACSHCMYSCGGENNRYAQGHMSTDVLYAVGRQVRYLVEHDVFPTINLVGGEPTINMGEFKRVLDHVATWGVDIEMTTNGWWLRSKEMTRRFLGIVAPYVDSNGYGVGGYDNAHGASFTVRISNDRWHDEFRPRWLLTRGLQNIVDDIWDSIEGEIFGKSRLECSYCDIDYSDDNFYEGDECPECGMTIEYTYESLLPEIPRPHPDVPWLYVEDSNRNYNVIPTGRAQGWGTNNLAFGHGCYAPSRVLSYTPDGTFTDFCCRGSHMGVRSAEDNPLALLYIASKYLTEKRPRCSECRLLTREWLEENDVDKMYNAIVDEIEKVLWELEKGEE